MAPSGTSVDGGGNIVDRLRIDRGLALIPNLDANAHSGCKTFVQTRTVAIFDSPSVEIAHY